MRSKCGFVWNVLSDTRPCHGTHAHAKFRGFKVVKKKRKEKFSVELF